MWPEISFKIAIVFGVSGYKQSMELEVVHGTGP